MPHGRISVPVYQALGKILDPSGPGITFTSIDDVVVPVQDLTRVMQRSQVKHYVFSFTQALTGDFTNSLQWDDISDWTEVTADDIDVTTDADMPKSDGTEDRIIINVAADLGGTKAEWNSSVLRRVPPTSTAQVMYVWSGVSANRLAGNIVPTAPWTLPVVLGTGERTVELDSDITYSSGVTVYWNIEMMVAPQGVMASYPGI